MLTLENCKPGSKLRISGTEKYIVSIEPVRKAVENGSYQSQSESNTIIHCSDGTRYRLFLISSELWGTNNGTLQFINNFYKTKCPCIVDLDSQLGIESKDIEVLDEV